MTTAINELCSPLLFVIHLLWKCIVEETLPGIAADCEDSCGALLET